VADAPCVTDRLRSSFREFLREINDLADVMVGVSGHAQEDGEMSIRARLGGIGIGPHQVVRGLLANRGGDHVYRAIEIREHLLFGRL